MDLGDQPQTLPVWDIGHFTVSLRPRVINVYEICHTLYTRKEGLIQKNVFVMG